MSTAPRYLKQLPTPIRVLLRPWLVVALGLHAVVLFLPMLPDKPEPEPELISLTELPPTAVPAPTVPPTPAASLPLKVLPAPVAPPTPTAVARPQIPPPPREPVIVPSPAPSTPAVAASPAPVTPSVQPSATPGPLASPVPLAEPSPAVPDYLANFPHAATTQACDQVEQCWRSPDSQWRGLAQTLEADLATQGYMLTEMPLDDETGRRVYEVSKEGEVVYYLNVISTLEGTVYRVTEQPLTAEEINAIAGF